MAAAVCHDHIAALKKDDSMQKVLVRNEYRIVPGSSECVLRALGQAPVNVQMRDVSRNGLGMSAPLPVPTGSAACVTCGELEITGIICHCREDESGKYILGLSIGRIIKAQTGAEI
jgi:hypothetical protein